jgi:hypothetical protein
MGRISHTSLKKRIVISGIATSKNHIELLVPGRFDLRQRRNRKFLGDDQGFLSKRTVLFISNNI